MLSLVFLVFVSATLSASLRATHREWRTCAARKHQDSLFRPSCFTHVCPCFVSCVPPAPIVHQFPQTHQAAHTCVQRSATVREKTRGRALQRGHRHRDHMQTCKAGLCLGDPQEIHSVVSRFTVLSGDPQSSLSQVSSCVHII